MSDPMQDPAYQRWLAKLSAQCGSCPTCWDVPCPGCLAGGICDGAMCQCTAPDCSDPCGDDGYDSDYEDQP